MLEVKAKYVTATCERCHVSIDDDPFETFYRRRLGDAEVVLCEGCSDDLDETNEDTDR